MEEENIDKIEVIMRQTEYTREESIEKLEKHNGDHISVIKEYLGVPNKKQQKTVSVNQEIYKQLRHKLDSNMRDYRDRVSKGETRNVM